MDWTKEDWEPAMALVTDLLTEIPANGGFQLKPGTIVPTSNTTQMEIPDNHPSGGGVKAPSGLLFEIPADGGFQTKPGVILPSNESRSNEIPNAHPSKSLLERVLDALNYGSDTATAWTIVNPKPKPQGKLNYGDDTAAAWQIVPGATKASARASEDLSGGDPQMPDGTFFIHNHDDLTIAIDKVRSAEQTAGNHPRYMDIKRHIAKRAVALGYPQEVPADWQLSMAQLASA